MRKQGKANTYKPKLQLSNLNFKYYVVNDSYQLKLFFL